MSRVRGVMSKISIRIGDERFAATFEDERAPQTCAAFRALLPWRGRIVHARWSGEACWVPAGDLDLQVGAEAATADAKPGEILFYPGGISEPELFVPYGQVRFACNAGPLAGNPLLRITERLERLADVGRDILWSGARSIVINQETS